MAEDILEERLLQLISSTKEQNKPALNITFYSLPEAVLKDIGQLTQLTSLSLVGCDVRVRELLRFYSSFTIGGSTIILVIH
jgi:hypothetical protein